MGPVTVFKALFKKVFAIPEDRVKNFTNATWLTGRIKELIDKASQ